MEEFKTLNRIKDDVVERNIITIEKTVAATRIADGQRVNPGLLHLHANM